MKLTLRFALSSAALALLISGAPLAQANAPSQPADAPALSALLENDEAIANGSLRFAQNCNYCHGSNGSGGKHRKLQCRDFTPDYVFDTISNGLESGSYFMPPWDHFSEEKRWELVAFIMSLGKLDTCG